MKKKLLSPQFLIVIMTFFLFLSRCDSSLNKDQEDNNDSNKLGNAQLITFGQTVTGYIAKMNERINYKIVLPEAGRLTVNISRAYNDGLDAAYIDWLDVNGVTISEIWTNTINSNKYSIDLDAGTYYIVIIGNAYTGTYYLSTDFISVESNEIEPNNTLKNAQLISSGQRIRGLLTLQDVDMYRIILTQSCRVTVNISSPYNYGLEAAYIDWLDVNGAIISEIWTNTINTNQYWIDLAAGTYYIAITQNGPYTGAYDLLIQY